MATKRRESDPAKKGRVRDHKPSDCRQKRNPISWNNQTRAEKQDVGLTQGKDRKRKELRARTATLPQTTNLVHQ